MEDEYLRQFMSSTRPTNLYAPNNNIPPPHHHSYDMLLFGASDPTTTNNTAAGGGTSSSVGGTVEFSGSGFEMEVGAGLSGGGVMGGGGSDIGANNNGRWPRQETLTLLEVRSRLDSKFKEANHKGPLWDELSRIMSEEHGYQRSGKKCREKFENLYKYYKKTKEGKAGRQDGKHYRFFRQLEALYGETNNNPIGANLFHDHNNVFQHHQNNPLLLPNNNNQEDTSFNLSNLSDSYTTSSDDSEFNEEEGIVKRKCKRSWKVKIKDFIDAKMRILMDKQEAWMEKMMTSIENKERERILREEEWRKQDAIRIERERKFWANERSWIETRDNELMDALRKLTGKELVKASTPEELIMNPNEDENNWSDGEVKRLIELRNGMEVKFGQCGILSEEVLWEEVASKLACCGYDRRNGLMCKEKWDSSVNDYHASLIKCNSKKRKENLISNSNNLYQQNNQEFFCDQLGGRGYSSCDAGGGEQGVKNMTVMRLNDNVGSSPISNRNTSGNAMNDSCFRYFMGDAYGRIMD